LVSASTEPPRIVTTSAELQIVCFLSHRRLTWFSVVAAWVLASPQLRLVALVEEDNAVQFIAPRKARPARATFSGRGPGKSVVSWTP